jgi:hypothetical protein
MKNRTKKIRPTSSPYAEGWILLLYSTLYMGYDVSKDATGTVVVIRNHNED